jgi:hypothetical protein
MQYAWFLSFSDKKPEVFAPLVPENRIERCKDFQPGLPPFARREGF